MPRGVSKVLYTVTLDGIPLQLHKNMSISLDGITVDQVRAYDGLAGQQSNVAKLFDWRRDKFQQELLTLRLLFCHCYPMFDFTAVAAEFLTSNYDGDRLLNIRVGRSGYVHLHPTMQWFRDVYETGNALVATSAEVGEGEYALQSVLRLSTAPLTVAMPFKGKNGYGIQVRAL